MGTCVICGKPQIEVNRKHPLAKGLAFFKVCDEPLGRYCTCDHIVDFVRGSESLKRDKNEEEKK